MKVLGFNFTKISVEKFTDKVEGLKINTNIDISNIADIKTDILKTEGSILGIDFKYSLDYDPNFAKIDLNGSLILSLDSSISKEVLEKWENKQMPEDFKLNLFNIILRKANLKALQLEEEMNLPLHIPFPSISPQPNSNSNQEDNPSN